MDELDSIKEYLDNKTKELYLEEEGKINATAYMIMKAGLDHNELPNYVWDRVLELADMGIRKQEIEKVLGVCWLDGFIFGFVHARREEFLGDG